MNRGFTIIELVVSIAIFVTMTVVVMAKYGTFNQSTLLTDTAYDIALAVRLAQTYGLSVKNAGSPGGTATFTQPYGMDFSSDLVGVSCGTAVTSRTSMTLFGDSYPASSPDGICGASDAAISSYAIARGAFVSNLCVGTDASTCHGAGGSVARLMVSYQRPNPEAVICKSTAGGGTQCSTSNSNILYAEVTVQGSDGTQRTIAIKQNGQISVIK